MGEEPEGGGHAERPVHRVLEDDPVQLSPAVIALPRRAPEGGSEGIAGEAVESAAQALQDEDVAAILRRRHAGDGEAVEAALADAVAHGEAIEEVAQRRHG